MGNPLNAVSLNAIGGLENLELEWNGRQLSAVTRNTQRYEYSYDSNGMRTEIREYKNGSLETVCHYAWQNGKLVGLDIRDGSGEVCYVIKREQLKIFKLKTSINLFLYLSFFFFCIKMVKNSSSSKFFYGRKCYEENE
ncbi:MAG: hypothetical protein J6K49_02635 [Clostridia bacterium]|nr:hypothetical protein [Clostridia bacterium]